MGGTGQDGIGQETMQAKPAATRLGRQGCRLGKGLQTHSSACRPRHLTQPCTHPFQPTHLVLCDGAADEDDDALALVLVLAVLQRQLRNLHRRGQVDVPLNAHLLHRVQDLAQVGRGRDQHLWGCQGAGGQEGVV